MFKTKRPMWVPEWANFYTIETINDGAKVVRFHKQLEQELEPPIYGIGNLYEQDREAMRPRNKYDREIRPGVYADVYDAVGAFFAEIPPEPLWLRIRDAIAHAAKKILAPGQRGHKELRQDLVEARDSIDRGIEMVDEWVGKNVDEWA